MMVAVDWLLNVVTGGFVLCSIDVIEFAIQINYIPNLLFAPERIVLCSFAIPSRGLAASGLSGPRQTKLPGKVEI